MKFKKAFLSLMTAATLLSSVFFTACGPKEPDHEPPYNPPAASAPEIEQPTRTVTETKLKIYEGPSLLESSSKLKAYVEDEELFVYETRVNHGRIHSWTQPTTKNQVVNFDFEGKVHVKVEVEKTTVKINKKDTSVDVVSLSDVTVRPLSYGIEPVVNGNVIEFDLEYSANYTVEYKAIYDNDGILTADVTDPADNALHVFANPIETDPITEEDAAEDDSIIYVGPGIYSAGAIPLVSGSTLYLAGGAYVYGNIRAAGLENVTIRGRGIISGEIYERRSDPEYTLPIELQKCKHVNIEGITMLDPAGWAVTLYMCEDVKLDNVKIITARSNGDGISVQSCKDVTVTGGFVRTWDDSLVVKNSDRGTTSNITFDNVTVWTDLAQSCEVGFETYGATMDGITFKNITILHNYHKAAMSIHNCDDADITNVLYESITIEDAQMLGDNRLDGENDFLIDITIAYSPEWTKSGGDRGTVSEITFNNIKVLSMLDSIICRIDGESDKSSVSNVFITGVEIEGEEITSEDELKLVHNTFAKSIAVRECEYDIFGAGVKLPYILELAAGDEAVPEIVATRQQAGLEVPEFAILDIEEAYMGVKLQLSKDAVISANHGVGTGVLAKDDPDYSVPFDKDDSAANAFDGDRNTAFFAKEWTGEENEYVALTVDFGEYKAPGVIRIYLDKDNPYVYDLRLSVFTKYSATENANGEPFVNRNGTVVPEVNLGADGKPKFTQLKENGKLVYEVDEGGKQILDSSGKPIPVVDKWTAASYGLSVSANTYSASPASGNYIDVKLPANLKCNSLQLRFFRTEGLTAQKQLKINEIAFYPCSLSTSKSIADSTEHYDVYPNSNILDGNENTYYESIRLWSDESTKNETAYLTVDLGRIYDVEYFVMHLPKSLAWETRTQEIEILVSEDNISWISAKEKTAYTFDPTTGNVNSVQLATRLKARYVKLVFYSNTAGYGAQLSELYVYGE